MKKIVALLLAVLMVLSLAACGGGGGSTPAPSDSAAPASNSPSGGGSSSEPAASTEPAASGEPAAPGEIVSARDTIRVGITGDTGNLNATTSTFANVSFQYREPLFFTDQNGNPIWLLATGKEDLSDTEWLIHLREGVTFSNGSPFTAEDVMFSLERMLAGSGKMFIADIDLEKSEIVDDYTIILRLSRANMQQWGSMINVLIVDKETYDEDEAVTRPIGTGAYVVTDYVMNSHLYMKANENYWGGKPPIENLQYIIITEDAQALNAMQTGTVDTVNVPTQDVEYASTLSDFNMVSYYLRYSTDMQFNVTDQSIFNNLDARLAVCYAADREAMVNLAYFGCGDVLHFPVSQHMYDYDDSLADLHDIYSHGHDVELAKQYAEKAGLVGQTIRVITNGGSAFVTEAEILQANLKEIGVTVQIDNYDAASFFNVYYDPSMYDIAMFAHSSPQGYAAGLLAENPMWSENSFKGWDKYYDYVAFGEKVLATMDDAARKEMLREETEMFEEGVLWYGICDTTANVAVRKGLEGVEIFNSGTLLYKTWYWTE